MGQSHGIMLRVIEGDVICYYTIGKQFQAMITKVQGYSYTITKDTLIRRPIHGDYEGSVVFDQRTQEAKFVLSLRYDSNTWEDIANHRDIVHCSCSQEYLYDYTIEIIR